MRWTFLVLFGLTVLAPLAGCGKASDRVLVSGKVTYLGEPVANGEIRFDAIGGTTQPAGASIRDGQYQAVGKGGVPVGKHRVSITAFRPNANAPAAPSGAGPMGGGGVPIQYLPAKYNTNSELTVTLEPGETKKTLDFDLKQ